MMHRDSLGNLKPICSLDDDHLMNIINLDFKPFQIDKKMQFITGIKAKEMNVESFNNILEERFHYIIEALRRDSTRDRCLIILGRHNPVFESRERIVITEEVKTIPERTNSKSNVEIIKHDCDDGFNEVDLSDDYFDPFSQ